MALIVTPQEGFTLVGWSGDCSGTDLSCDVAIDQIRNVSAQLISSFFFSLDNVPFIDNQQCSALNTNEQQVTCLNAYLSRLPRYTLPLQTSKNR